MKRRIFPLAMVPIIGLMVGAPAAYAHDEHGEVHQELNAEHRAGHEELNDEHAEGHDQLNAEQVVQRVG